MQTRRQFLRQSALGTAVVAASPALFSAESSAIESAGSAPGFVDLHSHWFSPRSIELLSRRSGYPRFGRDERGETVVYHAALGPGDSRPLALGAQWFDIDARLRHLEENGVAHQLISWPTTLNVDPSLSAAEAREVWGAYNEDLSGIVGRHRDRLSGVAVLSTADIAWSARELARAHEELGLIGGVLPVNGFDTLDGARVFAPLFEVAQRHRSHIYLHTGYANGAVPGQPPLPAHRDALGARAALDNASNFAAAAITLGYTDFLDPFPDVTVQVAQLGGSGAIALVAEVVERGAWRSASGDRPARFDQVTFDTGAAGRGPEAIALAVRVLGADRVVFGTDFAPQPSVVPVLENIRRSPLAAADRQKILSGNGRRILVAKGVAV